MDARFWGIYTYTLEEQVEWLAEGLADIRHRIQIERVDFYFRMAAATEMTVAANGHKLASSTDRCPHAHNHAGSTDRCLYSPRTYCFHRPVPVLAKNVLVPPNGARTHNKPAGSTDRCTDKPRTAFKKPYDAHRQTMCTKVYSTSAVPWFGRSHKYSIAFASYSYL